MANNATKHPLVLAIELHRTAIRRHADSQIIRNLELRVNQLAADLREEFWKTNDHFPIMTALVTNSSLTDLIPKTKRPRQGPCLGLIVSNNSKGSTR